MALDLENFEEVSQKAKKFYKNIQPIFTPYFKDNVYFSSQGLEHLKFKNKRRARPRQDQYMRFKLLHLAPKVLKVSASLQGILETKGFEKVRKNSITQNILKHITFYEFIAVIENVRVKIIIKQIDNGKYQFWSIIPHWGVNKDNKRKLHSGYPEHD